MDEFDEAKLFPSIVRRLVRKRKISAERWTDDKAEKFEEGMNPFLDIFTDEVVSNLFSKLKLPETTDKEKFRLDCAYAAEFVYRRVRNLGGPKTAVQSKKWSERVSKQTDKLLKELAKSEEFFGGDYFKGGDGQPRIVLAASLLETTKSVTKELLKLKMLVPFRHDFADDRIITHNRYYLQIIVFAVSWVFVRTYGVSKMTRTVDEGETRGLYPYFAEQLAAKLICAFYPSSGKTDALTLNLDNYLREAIKHRDKFALVKMRKT